MQPRKKPIVVETPISKSMTKTYDFAKDLESIDEAGEDDASMEINSS